MSLNKNILIGALVLAVAGLTYFLLQKPEDKVIKVPVVIEVPVPGIIGTFPPSELPKPIKVNPKPIIDTIPHKQRDSILQDALTIRTYKEVFKDSVQEVSVESEVQGKLLKQSVEYNIYPRKIKVDTVVEYKLPSPKIKLYAGGGVGTKTDFTNIEPVFQAGVAIQNKKDRILTINVDTEKKVMLGLYFKL